MSARQLEKLETKIRKLNDQWSVANRMGWDREALKRRVLKLGDFYLREKRALEERGVA